MNLAFTLRSQRNLRGSGWLATIAMTTLAVACSAGSRSPAAAGSGAGGDAPGGTSAGGSGASSGEAAGVGGSSGGAAGGGGSGASSGEAAGVGGSSGGAAGSPGGGGSGTAGSAGSAGGHGFSRYTCPPGPFDTDLSKLGTPSRINGAPPSDGFNNNGNDFTVVEGPVWITDALYFSEFGSTTKPPPSRILRIDASDNVTVAFPSISDTGSNGLAVDASGEIVSANHGAGGIVAFALPSGVPTTTLTSMYMGARFDSPNDLTIRSDGAIYFTDFAGAQAPSPLPQSAARVYRLPAGAKSATALFADSNNPNGIALSLDEQSLYVGGSRGVKKYAVNADGTVVATGTAVDPTDLDSQNTDGMALDCAGNLYFVRVNTHDIVVVGPSGQKLANVSVPGGGQITNAAFGGSDHKTLYITALGTGTTRGVFKLAMPLPGMPF
jgi:gluconolactonase